MTVLDLLFFDDDCFDVEVWGFIVDVPMRVVDDGDFADKDFGLAAEEGRVVPVVVRSFVWLLRIVEVEFILLLGF